MSSQHGGKIPRAVDILAIVFFVSIATVVALIVFVALNLPAGETEGEIAAPTVAVELLATTTHAPAPPPGFGPITFSAGLHGDPAAGIAASFPAGTTEVYATWGYENMQPGTPYRLSWYRDNTPWLNQPYVWDTEQHGSHGTAYHTPIGEYDADGLPPGNYRLELFVGDRQAQVATFVIGEPVKTELAHPSVQAAGKAALTSLVQVAVPYDSDWYLGGSGSIIDGDLGLILTNWHVLVDEESGGLLNEGSAAILHMTEPDAPPVFGYWARVLPEYSDPELDLAILRIVSRAEDQVPLQPPLGLPAIPLGDSEAVDLGDHVLLLGYPDYAADNPSWTEGIVATRNEEWLLSDAQASHGHSGGMLLNAQGELIGVLTGYAETSVGGGFVRARPINLTAPLVEGAQAAE